MLRSTTAFRAGTVLGVSVLALAACSSGSSGGSEASASSSSSAVTSVADGTLTIGTLLPQTGSLAFLGPPEFAGVDLAIQEINAAGGVLGQQVAKIDTDSGDTSTDIASQSVDKLLSGGADVIVGAASSGVSLTVIDKITGAGVIEISPANTSNDFTDYPDNGLYFRTAPPDTLQGRVLGDLILEDGYASIGIMALQDPYGTGLADNITSTIEEGGGEVAETVIYDPKASSFSAEVAKIKAAGVDAIALVAFDETKKIVPEMVKQGIDMSKVYFVDGNLADYSADFAEGTLTGAKGTTPGAQADDAFKKKLLAINADLDSYSYAAESYDAVNLTALAAVAAGSDAGTDIAAHMQEVSASGTKCTDFATCKALLDEGEDIDYDGVSGPVEFNDAGDPSEATIGIYQYKADNTYTFLESKEGQI